MRTNTLLALVVLFAFSAFAQDPDPNVIVVISDLHLGSGERNVGEWSPYEDFRWGADFVLFLNEVHRLSGGAATLVIAGDAFELWQSDTIPCPGPTNELGCSLEQALSRIRTVLRAHQLEMQALGEFASRGRNRVLFVPGNHDAAITHNAVWQEVLKAVRVKDESRVQRVASGTYVSPHGRVVVEHGHQWDEVNRFAGWPTPFVAVGGQTFFQRPWGEQLVRKFYDGLEVKYEALDNFSGDLDGLAYGFAVEGLGGTSLEELRFVKMVVRNNSLRQFTDLLGGDKPPEWNVTESRNRGMRFLIDSVPADVEEANALRAALPVDTTALDATVKDPSIFVDEDILAACESRFVVWREQKELDIPEDKRIALCPTVDDNLGYIKSKSVVKVRGYDVRLSEYLTERLRTLKDVDLSASNVLYVYGHTHGARAKFRPRVSYDNVLAANSGAWQRLISPSAVKARYKDPKLVLKNLKLETLPPCYSAIWIRFSGDSTADLDPALVYWAYDGTKETWSFARTCPERE